MNPPASPRRRDGGLAGPGVPGHRPQPGAIHRRSGLLVQVDPGRVDPHRLQASTCRSRFCFTSIPSHTPGPHPSRTGSQIRTDESTLNNEHDIWDGPASVSIVRTTKSQTVPLPRLRTLVGFVQLAAAGPNAGSARRGPDRHPRRRRGVPEGVQPVPLTDRWRLGEVDCTRVTEADRAVRRLLQEGCRGPRGPASRRGPP
jgi:hypothetical protein